MGLFDPFGALPAGAHVKPGVPYPGKLFRLWLFNLFLGPYTMGRICSRSKAPLRQALQHSFKISSIHYIRVYKRLHPFTYSILFFSCEFFFVTFQVELRNVHVRYPAHAIWYVDRFWLW